MRCELVEIGSGQSDSGMIACVSDHFIVGVMSYVTIYLCFSDVRLEETYFNKDVEKVFMSASENLYKQKTLPSLLLANQVGNMYTPSLYGGLVSYIHSQ